LAIQRVMLPGPRFGEFGSNAARDRVSRFGTTQRHLPLELLDEVSNMLTDTRRELLGSGRQR
jgi:hypothetical protein